ncbi:MAG: hypothetical protein MZW92_12655 [Comamonadaceae bacterium]|nr:hypothetical protein [Comamonadaceae bacterium]
MRARSPSPARARGSSSRTRPPTLAGAFKARRASISAYERQEAGLRGRDRGDVAATTAPPSPARRRATACKCIIVQEIFDSRGVGQPEIVEKARACEAYGAEVAAALRRARALLPHCSNCSTTTGYFNAIALHAVRRPRHRDARRSRSPREMPAPTGAAARLPSSSPTPAAATLTGTARGLQRAGATGTQIVARSRRPQRACTWPATDDFNRKSLHHRPHRLRRALRHLAGPRRRAAQRRPGRCATWTATCTVTPGRGLLRHRGR